MKKFTLLFSAVLLGFGMMAQQRESVTSGLRNDSNTGLQKTSAVQNLSAKSSNVKSFIYSEGFETSPDPSTGALPEGWTVTRSTTIAAGPGAAATTGKWFRHEPGVYGFSTGDYVRTGVAAMAIGYTAPEFTWAISPEIVVPAAGANPLYLEFWTWYVNDGGSGFYPTNYYVAVKADGVWNTVQSVIGSAEVPNNEFEVSSLIEMGAYAGKTIQIAFIYEYTDGYQMAVDDIVLYEVANSDFVLENTAFGPTFALVPGTELTFAGTVRCNGLTEGQPTVSLKVNGVEESSAQVTTVLYYGDTEDVEFTYTPTVAGDYTFELVLEADDVLENNSFDGSFFVYEAITFAEDFENIDWTDPENPVVIFPPVGWAQTANTNDWAWTSTYAIDGQIAASCKQVLNDPEALLVTPAITIAEGKVMRPSTLSFLTTGLNNGYGYGNSTLVVKYATEYPSTNWTELLSFELVDDGAVEHNIDISELPVGTYYFAFAATSAFSYQTYLSFVFVDNVIIFNEEITGVNNNTFANFNVYPNPFSNHINISNPALINRIVVTNVVGQNVLDVNTNGASQIETSNLAAGLYIVSFEANNGERFVSKMIKK